MKTKYQCDYCWRYFYSKKECLTHEKEECDENPKVKSCGTCEHFEEGGDNVTYYSCEAGHKETSTRSWKRNCEYWKKQG
jgi:hypothetical protein